MRFVSIQAHARIYHITTMCRVLEVSKAGYYAWRGRPLGERVQENRVLAAKIREIHAQVKGPGSRLRHPGVAAPTRKGAKYPQGHA
ncbi:MAG: hypothetical protein ABIP93_10445 [Gemmatimonadaceae bacterium]